MPFATTKNLQTRKNGAKEHLPKVVSIAILELLESFNSDLNVTHKNHLGMET